MVLFCVERRKAWRLLQSRAGVHNQDYQAQRALLKRVDAGEISIAHLRQHGRELLETVVMRNNVVPVSQSLESRVIRRPVALHPIASHH
jgi:hypothetical protein